MLHAHGDELVRVKGIVRTPAGRLLLQAVRGTVQPPEVLPDTLASDGTAEEVENVIVFIGRGLEDDRIGRSFRVHMA